MNSARTVRWESSALPEASARQWMSLGLFIATMGLLAALVCSSANVHKETVLSPARSLYVVIKTESYTRAWREYLEEQSTVVGVAVMSDQEAPDGTPASVRWRVATHLATEGILVDGVEWIDLPARPPAVKSKN